MAFTSSSCRMGERADSGSSKKKSPPCLFAPNTAETPSGGRLLLALALAVLLGGSATGPPRGSLTSGFGLLSRSNPRRDAAGPGPRAATPPLGEAEGAAGGFPEQTRDFFQGVQEASGLGEEARHPVGAALYLEQARQLLKQLARTPVTQRNFAPRRALCWLLREVLEGGDRVEYADLKWRAERLGPLVLVRPDGYLVTALDGTPLQRLGPLELVEGEWRVGRLVVGGFYVSHGGVFYPATEALRRADGAPLAELGLGRDALNAALDGAQEALAEMALALAHSILHPIRTLEDGKFDEMMRQAERQSKLAQQLGLSVAWHVADAKVAEFLRKELARRRWNNTTVHHTPPAR